MGTEARHCRGRVRAVSSGHDVQGNAFGTCNCDRHRTPNAVYNVKFDRQMGWLVLAWIRLLLCLDDGRTKTWAPKQDVVEGECVRCLPGTTCKAMRSVPTIVTVIALRTRGIMFRLLANTALSLMCTARRAKRGHRRNLVAVSIILLPCVAGRDWA